MRQLPLFSPAELTSMRDRTRSRNYSAEREEFRRDHERRRAWGLVRRHEQKLRRAHGEACTCRVARPLTEDAPPGTPSKPLQWTTPVHCAVALRKLAAATTPQAGSDRTLEPQVSPARTPEPAAHGHTPEPTPPLTPPARVPEPAAPQARPSHIPEPAAPQAEPSRISEPVFAQATAGCVPGAATRETRSGRVSSRRRARPEGGRAPEPASRETRLGRAFGPARPQARPDMPLVQGYRRLGRAPANRRRVGGQGLARGWWTLRRGRRHAEKGGRAGTGGALEGGAEGGRGRGSRKGDGEMGRGGRGMAHRSAVASGCRLAAGSDGVAEYDSRRDPRGWRETIRGRTRWE